jgi:hypothetical protein
LNLLTSLANRPTNFSKKPPTQGNSLLTYLRSNYFVSISMTGFKMASLRAGLQAALFAFNSLFSLFKYRQLEYLNPVVGIFQ